MNIQWYPGHMTKAKRQMEDSRKKIQAVLEIIDARIPISSRNPDFDDIFVGKKRLLVLNKADMADEKATKAWIEHYAAKGIPAIDLCAVRKNDRKRLVAFIKKGMADKLAANEKRGIKKTLTIMAAGIPNSGKSTVINLLAGGAAAKTGNKPGVTRGQQRIRISDHIHLMDSPGVLWPKFEDDRTALNLAFTGAIREQVLDTWHLATALVEQASHSIPDKLMKRYKLDQLPESGAEILELIARKRGFLIRGGEVDLERAATMVLNEFRSGKWGALTMEQPEEKQDA